MMFMSPWLFFALTAAVGLFGLNVCAKVAGEQMPAVVFAFILYAAGFLCITPAFLFFLKGKESGFLTSLPAAPVGVAALAGVSVVVADVALAAMYGRQAPLGLGITVAQTVALFLTLVIGFVFFQERHSPVNTAGLILALLSVPLMLYQTK